MYFYKSNDEKIIKKGFKPPNQMVNKIFKIIAKYETMLFSKPILGTSLLLVAQK